MNIYIYVYYSMLCYYLYCIIRGPSELFITCKVYDFLRSPFISAICIVFNIYIYMRFNKYIL